MHAREGQTVQNRLLLATGCGLIIIGIAGLLWWARSPATPRDGSARERARAMAGLPVTAEVTAASVQAGLLRQLPLGTYNKDVQAYLAAYGITQDQFYAARLDEGSVQWSISISSVPGPDVTALYVPLDASPLPVDMGFSVMFRFVGYTASVKYTRLESIIVQ
jgi:hypothetical protein